MSLLTAEAGSADVCSDRSPKTERRMICYLARPNILCPIVSDLIDMCLVLHNRGCVGPATKFRSAYDACVRCPNHIADDTENGTRGQSPCKESNAM